MFHLVFRREVNQAETRVTGESCMILTSAVFDWSTRVPDGQPDRRTDGRTGDSI